MGKDQTEPSRQFIPRPHTSEPKLELADAEAMLQVLADVFLREQSVSGAPANDPFSMDSSSNDPSEPVLLFSEEDRYRTLVNQLPAVVFMASLDKGIGNAYVS